MVGRGGRIVFFFFNDTATTEIYTLSYTTLFRSRLAAHAAHDVVADGEVLEAATGAVAIVACADVNRGALVLRGLVAAVELVVDEMIVVEHAAVIGHSQ